jgi:hypothetical protein
MSPGNLVPMTESSLCEACRRAPVEVVVADDGPDQPYRLCRACERRLRHYSLRPLEWFNLASIHGPGKHCLHDDFYFDNGIAGQPDGDVDEPEQYPAPTSDQVQDDPERLIDYAMTCYVLKENDPVVRYLSRHDRSVIVRSLQRRIATARNFDIERTAYEICAYALGPAAADWIRSRWKDHSPEAFSQLARTSAYCLPFDEAFERITQALEELAPSERADNCYALAALRSLRVLDWIEAHQAPAKRDVWGRLAAVSRFSWPKAVAWLEQGPPLSREALAAIEACYRYDTIDLKRWRPMLEQPASAEEMSAVLDAYLLKDDTPRVRQRVERVKAAFRAGPADAW